MAEPQVDRELAWEIAYHHRQDDVVIKFEGQPGIRIPFARTYLEQFDQDARAGMHPPGMKRPKPRRGPCPHRYKRRNDCVQRAIDHLTSQSLSLRKAYEELEIVLAEEFYIEGFTDKAIERAYREARSRNPKK